MPAWSSYLVLLCEGIPLRLNLADRSLYGLNALPLLETHELRDYIHVPDHLDRDALPRQRFNHSVELNDRLQKSNLLLGLAVGVDIMEGALDQEALPEHFSEEQHQPLLVR